MSVRPVAGKGYAGELTLVDVCFDLQPIDGTQDRLCRGQNSITHDLQAQGTPSEHSCSTCSTVLLGTVHRVLLR